MIEEIYIGFRTSYLKNCDGANIAEWVGFVMFSKPPVRRSPYENRAVHHDRLDGLEGFTAQSKVRNGLPLKQAESPPLAL
jgi:hypothetical protein